MTGKRTLSQLQRALIFSRDFIRRHWRGALLWRHRLRLTEETIHLLLAVAVGLAGAGASLAYHLLSQLVKWTLLGDAGDIADSAAAMAPWQRLLLPAVGGLMAGLVLFLGLRLIGNPGLTNLLEVVVAGDGRLRLRPALLNALSSLVSLTTGASIGREGLIIQVSSTLGSKMGQIAGWPPYRLRLLVACGAAAGIAAGCNAPIAGAVFAAQIVLGNFSLNLFAPLVVSSVIAAVLPRAVFGSGHWFDAPLFEFTRLAQLPWFPVLGVMAGIAGAGFLKALSLSAKMFGKMSMPLFGRMAVAGLLVGALALAYPQVLGNGHAPTNRMLREEPVLLFVLGLFAAKFLATTLTVGSGTVGGVFTPTLFLGAALGSVYEALLNTFGWAVDLPAGCFALVGMGAMLAATTHSPLLAMIMVFELSLNYSLMPPLMLACAVSTLVARRLQRESIYTEPLRRQGIELDREGPRLGAATERTVADLMRQPVPPVRENTPFRKLAGRFLTSTNNFLPVVDSEERLIGVVALHDLKEYLNAGEELDSVIALDVMRPPPPVLMPQQSVADVLPVLLASELRNVPVVNNARQGRLIGAVARAEALGLVSEAIAARAAAE
ncbi:MAG: chloride channel protein family [Verrucomicrobiota bacterium]|jgi:CIC family chloride channel protein